MLTKCILQSGSLSALGVFATVLMFPDQQLCSPADLSP